MFIILSIVSISIGIGAGLGIRYAINPAPSQLVKIKVWKDLHPKSPNAHKYIIER